MELKLIALAALVLLFGILRIRRRVLAEEAALNAFLAELRRRKEIELREFARGGEHDRFDRRFGDLSRSGQ